jgi:hypothetical protein
MRVISSRITSVAAATEVRASSDRMRVVSRATATVQAWAIAPAGTPRTAAAHTPAGVGAPARVVGGAGGMAAPREK